LKIPELRIGLCKVVLAETVTKK